MNVVAVLDMDLRLPDETSNLPGEVEPLDCYALATSNLDAYAGLIVPTMVDQEFLHRQRKLLRAYLDRGGVIAFSGQLHRPWLPGAGLFEPKRVRSFRDYEVRIVADHPIFAGVEASDLTYRRGVAGFFARGYHRPPPGAERLVSFTSGEPVVYIDRDSTGGTLLVHAGNDLLNLSRQRSRTDLSRSWAKPRPLLLQDSSPAPNLAGSSASRVPGQLLAWIRDVRRGS